MSIYLIFNNLMVRRANMMQSPYLYAPVPVFPSVCTGHKLGCMLDCEVDGVGVVHHRAEPLIEQMAQMNQGSNRVNIVTSPIQFRGTPSGKQVNTKDPIGLPMQPTMTAHLEISLIFRVNGRVPTVEAAREAMQGLRIAGGSLNYISSRRVKLKDDLIGALAEVSNGFWISDAMHLVQQRLDEGFDPVSAIFQKADKGWYVPANLGYCAVTDFKQRQGGRTLVWEDGRVDEPEIALADNMIGLVRYDPLYGVKQELNSGGTVGMWHFDFTDDTFFVVKQ
ncbi:CRISPR-associated protein Csy2 [Desulfonatronospira thiodismutans ASO3-1]|uniref:CRISPR-associated protein Csy2 n=1 Tax=Desulfonatronospira thiodismutans ASO3-1 TaxID=555779 RepID=D6SNR6_9BACT|nr:type I-F CRISPR-associated protein Csy2 [Desulfonatronospira thiodismutans]EFI34392.1 CRISPR-associated protein Csy2 [Desulfonatronospira thiodismutans ASO3-1]